MVSNSKKPAKKTAKKVAKKPVAKKAAKKTSSKIPAQKTAKKSSTKNAVTKRSAVKKSVKSATMKPAAKSLTKNVSTKSPTTRKKDNETMTASKVGSISGSTFLFTGTLTGMQRKEAEALVKENGGSILSGVSNKLNYLVVGEDAGSKLAKAKSIKTIKILTEKEFIKLLNNNASLPARTSPNSVFGTEHPLKVYIGLSGNGIDFRVKTIYNDDQIEYWKNKIEDGDSRELLDHLLNFEDYVENGRESWHLDYFDNIGDNFQLIGPEYSNSTILKISVFKNDESDSEPADNDLLKEISIPITDNVLKKGQPLGEDDIYFFRSIGRDGFLDLKQESEDETFLCAISYDSGGYFKHEIDIPAGEGFDLKNINYHLFEITGTKQNDNTIVEALSYNGNILKCKPGAWLTDNDSNDAEMIFSQE